MDEELFAIVDYEDGSRDISVSLIVQPRKDYYRVGEDVLARCPGYSGKFPGTIAAIHPDRNLLKKYVIGPRPVPIISWSKPEVQTPGVEGTESKSKARTIEHKNERPEEERDEKKRTEEERDEKKRTETERTDRQKNDSKVGGSGKKKEEIKRPEGKTNETTMKKNNDPAKAPEDTIKRKENEKKRKNDEIESEAKRAKAEESEIRRKREKERQRVLLEQSQNLLMPSTDYEAKLDLILNKVTSLGHFYEQIQARQAVMDAKLDSLTEIANCSKCLRSKYKLTQRSGLLEHHAPAASSTSSPASVDLVTVMSAKKNLPFLEDNVKQILSPGGDVGGSAIDADYGSGNASNSELVTLGESKYAIKVKKSDLDRAKISSKNIVKLGLNCIEFLLTPEECRDNLTVYGEGKGKRSMPEDRRKALRSELFNNYHQILAEEEKERLWIEMIVPKINNKIRGIRNNRYHNAK